MILLVTALTKETYFNISNDKFENNYWKLDHLLIFSLAAKILA